MLVFLRSVIPTVFCDLTASTSSFVFTYCISFISRTLLCHSCVYVHLAILCGVVTTRSHCILEFTVFQNGKAYTSFGFGSFFSEFEHDGNIFVKL